MRKVLLDEEDHHEEGLLNLTPLIDVVFVVLICFILIAPMLEIDRIDLASSSEQKEERDPLMQPKIALSLREDDTIWLNKEKLLLPDLGARLKSLRKIYPKEHLHLFSDRKAHFGAYQEIKNIAESCGFEELDVVLAPPQKK